MRMSIISAAVLASVVMLTGCSASTPDAAPPAAQPSTSSAYHWAQSLGYLPVPDAPTPAQTGLPEDQIVKLPDGSTPVVVFTAGSGKHAYIVAVSDPAKSSTTVKLSQAPKPPAPAPIVITATPAGPTVIAFPHPSPSASTSRTASASPTPSPSGSTSSSTSTGPSPAPSSATPKSSQTYTPPTTGPSVTSTPSDAPTYLVPTPSPTLIRPLPSFPTFDGTNGATLSTDMPSTWLMPDTLAGIPVTSSTVESVKSLTFYYNMPTAVIPSGSQSIEADSLVAASVTYESVRTDLLAAGFSEVMSRGYLQGEPGVCPAGQIVGGFARDNQRLMLIVSRSGPTCTAQGSNQILMMLTGA